ncbi:hypothetical protein AMECASPLE_016372 [Ameca splendens]|uniref:Uncharacterized protein n=1 Tax=Ameca splendens TaxID=208324 RepID=A0ABV1A0X7_9TELE
MRAPGEPPSSRNAEAPGSSSDEPKGPTSSHLHTGADPAMQPPSRGPTEPGGPGPGKQPPGVSWHAPKHPAPDTKNHQYTSGQRHQPPAGSVAGRKYAPHLMGGRS